MTVTIRRKTLGIILGTNAMVLLGLVAADAVVLAKVDNAAGNVAQLQQTYHNDQVSANKGQLAQQKATTIQQRKEQKASIEYVHALIAGLESSNDRQIAAAVRELEVWMRGHDRR